MPYAVCSMLYAACFMLNGVCFTLYIDCCVLYAVCSDVLLNVLYCNVLRRFRRQNASSEEGKLCHFLFLDSNWYLMLYVGSMLYAVCFTMLFNVSYCNVLRRFRMLHVVCCMLYTVCRTLHIVYCMVYAVRGMLYAVCCKLCGVCCILNFWCCT